MDDLEQESLLLYLRKRSRLDASTGCLEWTMSTTDYGKGQMWWDGNVHLVHRKKWEALHGPIPPKLYVIQTCGNGLCHAEDHLKLATVRESRIEARRRRVAAGR